MSRMTPERLQAIEDRLPGEVFPNSVERDTLDLLDEVRRLRAIEVDIEATTTGQRCTVKHTGVTIFKGVSLEATLTTEAHDRQVAAKALREAAGEINNPNATPDIESVARAVVYLYDRADRIEQAGGAS